MPSKRELVISRAQASPSGVDGAKMAMFVHLSSSFKLKAFLR